MKYGKQCTASTNLKRTDPPWMSAQKRSETNIAFCIKKIFFKFKKPATIR